MMFLVEGSITHTPYMGKSKKTKVIRLVMAENETEAAAKFERAIAAQTVEYQDYYCGYADEVHAAIE